MLKIGIITQYSGNLNCGGQLQAYALTKYLNNNGWDAKQINYPVQKDTTCEKICRKFLRKFLKSPLDCFSSCFARIMDKFHKKELIKLREMYEEKYASFKQFSDLIPHTNEEYFDTDLYKLNNVFDVFITGSDQVFNFDMLKIGYLLNFVDRNKLRIAYAASMGREKLSMKESKFLKDSLKRFNAISVREDSVVSYLEKLTGQNVEYVVDPVFLLERSDWEEIAPASNPIKNENIKADGKGGKKECCQKRDEYILTYFLGKNDASRQIAKEYANLKKLQIVNIPMYHDRYRYYDMDYGDINLPFATPQDFISLIRDAKCIFTDSFHACAFSLIYGKSFIVFNRRKKDEMSGRIRSLMRLFGTEEYYFNNVNNSNEIDLNKIINLLDMKKEYDYSNFLKLKSISQSFIERNLNNVRPEQPEQSNTGGL